MSFLDPTQGFDPGMTYRLNAGFGFRVAGDNAKNDGLLGTLEIGYRTGRFGDHFSLETGSSLDLFGETQHLAAYAQLNYHPHQDWILSLRTMAGGVSDDKEKTAAAANPSGEDEQDLGAVTHGSLQVSYRVEPSVFLGMRSGLEWQIYGKSGGDQGTQVSWINLFHLGYQF